MAAFHGEAPLRLCPWPSRAGMRFGARLIAASGEAVGEGAGRPGLARCDCVLPFRRSRPLRVVRFPRALRLAAFMRALPDHPPGPLLDRRRGERHVTRTDRRAPRPAASRRTPSIDARKDPRGTLPPGFIARPQPAAIENVDPTPSPSTGWAVLCGRGEGCCEDGGLKYSTH